ncbi:ethanolamine utilization protein EutN [Vallitalea longa]|uniref:Ethanolamine utilization protein EutN n=1 Tax=Vallitalea longa TaxID=2936439 RepID=A0A9W5Y8T8_9FIRM|nr:EutN/CcmL family microcompartment protein [Vallitalea longa]GKX28161.1 ethanolamine utilization protein EutN [Vallitalea longa]
MIIGKVIGTLVSTRKLNNLVGSKFLVIESASNMGTDKRIVAVDQVGAGIGDFVLVALGSAARIGALKEASIDAAVVGIIDDENDILDTF